MSDQLIISLIANVPNLIGFIVLAYMQQRMIVWLQKLVERLTDEDGEIAIVKRDAKM